MIKRNKKIGIIGVLSILFLISGIIIMVLKKTAEGGIISGVGILLLILSTIFEE